MFLYRFESDLLSKDLLMVSIDRRYYRIFKFSASVCTSHEHLTIHADPGADSRTHVYVYKTIIFSYRCCRIHLTSAGKIDIIIYIDRKFDLICEWAHCFFKWNISHTYQIAVKDDLFIRIYRAWQSDTNSKYLVAIFAYHGIQFISDFTYSIMILYVNSIIYPELHKLARKVHNTVLDKIAFKYHARTII